MKEKYILLGLLIVVIFSMNFVSAADSIQPSTQTNKIFLNPFYRASMTAGTNYSYNLNVPNGQYVDSAIISFDVYLNPTVNFNVWVNNISCNTPLFTISTTFASAGQSRITFDCSNVITKSGSYVVKIRPTSANTGALTGWADITWSNKPKASIEVHGTEYTYGQTAKVWLQLLDPSGANVDSAVCYADIYTPLGGYLVEGATMTNMAHDGIYYYDLPVPIRQGVYPAIAKCYYTAGQNPRNATASAVVTGTVTGTVADTTTLNLVYYTLRTTGGGSNNRLNATFNFSDYYTNCGTVSESLITGLTIYWNGVWNTATVNHDVTISVYNYTSGGWVNFPNKVLGGSGATTLTVSNSFSMKNITKLLGVTSSNPLRIKTADNANTEGGKDFKTDYLYASCDQLSNSTWQEVKGGSEMHVTNPEFFAVTTDDDIYNITNTVSTTLVNGTVITETYYTGIFRNNFEVSSGALNTKDVVVEYQGLHSIPCNAILALYYVNDTGYYMHNFTTQRQTTEDHCSVNIPITLEPYAIYNFEVHARNVWESEMRSTNTGVGAIYPLVNAGCLLWQQVKGYPAYITPKNQTNENKDYYYRSCGNFYDDYYWFNKTYNQALTNKALIQTEQGYVQYEADYFSNRFAAEKLNTVTTLLLQNLLAVGQYSKLLVDNPLGNLTNTSDQQYWGQQSTIYKNWLLINASCGTGVCLVNNTVVASDIWSATNRNLTYYPPQIDMTNYSRVSNLTTSDVWSYASRNLTWYQDVTNYTLIANTVWGSSATISIGLLNQIADAVWTRTDRNLTYYPPQVDMTNYTLMAETVWNNAVRNLTSYPTQTDLTNYTQIIDGVTVSVWNATDRNLTYYQNFGDQTNYTQIVIGVWNATDRNLTFYPAQVDLTNYTAITENVVSGVWNATDRNLTYYPTAIDMTNYSQIADVVWNAVDRNLTYTNDVTDYNRIIVGVWNATDRNLTFYPAQVDMTNYTLIGELVANNSINYTLVADNVWQWNGVIVQNILNQIGSSTADAVWNATDRNLTYYPPAYVNYTLIAESVWQNLNRTLTDFNFTVTANVNETAIADAVWQSIDRTLTSFNFTVNATMDVNNTALADAVWSAVNRTLTDYNQTDLTDYALIQTMVWNATDRNLTYYQNFGDQTNYTLMQEMVWNATVRTLTEMNITINTTEIADAVWTYVNRSLTECSSCNQTDLTDYTLIQTMVWNATTRTLTDFNFSINATVDNQAIAGAVWNYTNKTVDFATTGTTENVSLVQNIQNMGHTYVGGTEYTAGDAGKIAIRLVRGTGNLAAVETGATCKLTINYPNGTLYVNETAMDEIGNGAYTYDFTVPIYTGIYVYYTDCNVSDRNYYSLDDFHIYENNFTSIAPSVWNYTTRNLTDNGNDISASDVWNYGTRELTYYPTANLTLSNESIQALGDAVWNYTGPINQNILTQFSDAVSCKIQNLLTGLNLKWGVHINSC